jgi:predicted transcriptional regulator
MSSWLTYPIRGVTVKSMTLRLDDERAATLELIARAEDKTMTDAVRAAIDALIEDRRKDKEFMERLRERHERERALYERLAK